MYIATFSYVQKIGTEVAEGNFQVVGYDPKPPIDKPAPPLPASRAAFLTELALEKVKKMVASKAVDFAGEVEFYLDSLIELSISVLLNQTVVINLFESAPSVDDHMSLAEVPLDEDVDAVVVHRSSQIWNRGKTSSPVYVSKIETPAKGL